MPDDTQVQTGAELSLDSNDSSPYQARIGDKGLEQFPSDLHVPPDAMIVMLESFRRSLGSLTLPDSKAKL